MVTNQVNSAKARYFLELWSYLYCSSSPMYTDSNGLPNCLTTKAASVAITCFYTNNSTYAKDILKWAKRFSQGSFRDKEFI